MNIKSDVNPANHVPSETAVDVSDLRLKHSVCSNCIASKASNV